MHNRTWQGSDCDLMSHHSPCCPLRSSHTRASTPPVPQAHSFLGGLYLLFPLPGLFFLLIFIRLPSPCHSTSSNVASSERSLLSSPSDTSSFFSVNTTYFAGRDFIILHFSHVAICLYFIHLYFLLKCELLATKELVCLY